MYKQKCILWNDIKKKSIRKREKKNLSHLKFGSGKTVKALIQVFCTNAPINDALEFTSRELLQNCFVSKIFWIEKNFDPIYRIYVDLKKRILSSTTSNLKIKIVLLFLILLRHVDSEKIKLCRKCIFTIIFTILLLFILNNVVLKFIKFIKFYLH